MNKVILMGRVTRDIEVRYTSGENQMAVARYSLAVPRRFKRDGEADADFINCVAFGKQAEFAEKYFHKGIKIVISGRIQTGSYTNRDGQKVYTTDVVIEEQEFAESKNADSSSGSGSGNNYGGGSTGQNYGGNTQGRQQQNNGYQQGSFNTDKDGFMHIDDGIDEELPFH